MKPIRFAVCTMLAFATVANAGDWTNWRGPGARGFSPETGLPSSWSPDPKADDSNLVWQAHFGSRSTPLVMNGRVYLLNYASEKTTSGKDVAETIQERVMCLDFDTGKKIWERTYNVFHTDIVTVRLGWTNMVADPITGYVYAHGTQGFLVCLDGKTGDTVWQRSLSEEYGRITGYGGRVTSPCLYNDLVIIGMLNSSWGDQGKGGNRFVAFDKKSGQVRWWSEPGGQPKDTYYSVPVVANINGVDLVISGGADGGVYAMKAATGEKVWGYTFGTTAVNCSPVVDGNLVYIGQGEENPDNNEQGRVICLDASKVKDGKPELVWHIDGLKARYTSPILHEGKFYITDDVGRLYCIDGKTGKQLWKSTYGRNSRGSPVLADGKIYVGEVNGKFHILDAKNKGKRLHQQFFSSDDGISDVEINGSPAVAHGRVIFSTSDGTYCIGAKEAKKSPDPQSTAAPPKSEGPITHLQVVPADVELHPGGAAQFKVFGYDANGVFVKEVSAEWSLPEPPLPKGAKTGPPALAGTIKDGALTVDAKKPSQQGYVVAKAEKLEGKARVRVAPVFPYEQDFSKVPDGAVPGGWVNTQGKFLVATVNGEKLLRKVNDKASPLIAKGNAYIGLPTDKDYVIEADVQGSKSGDDLPDMGVVNNRYTLLLWGNSGKLRLASWEALPRVDRTIPYKLEPGQWYRLKLAVESTGKTSTAKGKIWKRGEQEPSDWTISVDDPRPNNEGAPALYGYVTGIPEGGAGTEIYYDNVKITPHKK
jgi:outer membrane protein assembly factor BamB